MLKLCCQCNSSIPKIPPFLKFLEFTLPAYYDCFMINEELTFVSHKAEK